MMELEIELKCASDYLKKWSKSSISLVTLPRSLAGQHCSPTTSNSCTRRRCQDVRCTYRQ